MLKKILLTNIMLAASGVVLANGGGFVPPASNCVGAFYVGAAVSRDLAHFKTNDKISILSTSIDDGSLLQDPASTDFRRKLDWNADGYGGEILAGYGLVFNDHFTLAAEAFGDLSSAKGRFNEALTSPSLNSTFINNGNIRVRNSFGVSLLPGFKLSSSTNLYARVGWIDSRFKQQANIVSTSFNTVTTPVNTQLQFNAFALQATFPSYKSGIQLGLGMETMVTQNVGIRGEYDWNRYGNVNGVKPTIDQFKLAAIYHFYS